MENIKWWCWHCSWNINQRFRYDWGKARKGGKEKKNLSTKATLNMTTLNILIYPMKQMTRVLPFKELFNIPSSKSVQTNIFLNTFFWCVKTCNRILSRQWAAEMNSHQEREMILPFYFEGAKIIWFSFNCIQKLATNAALIFGNANEVIWYPWPNCASQCPAENRVLWAQNWPNNWFPRGKGTRVDALWHRCIPSLGLHFQNWPLHSVPQIDSVACTELACASQSHWF